MAIVATDNTHYGNIAAAIREKNGLTAAYKPSEMAEAIRAIQTGGGGGGSVSPKEVNFYDYDGTLVAAYTVAEAQALTALPDGPVHEGLVFQGWNWTLDKVKALTRPMNVGAMYITDDGKTRLYIRIAAEGRMNVPLYFSQTVAGGVTIDWGDGSGTQTLAGTGNVNTTHAYQGVGDYVITLDPANGCTLGVGRASSSYCVMGGSTGNGGAVYCNMLRKVEIGRGVASIGRCAFYFCYSLASVTIPDGVTSIGDYAFYFCYSLASVTIPDGVTSIGDYAFQSCYSLTSISIPDGVTSIGNNAFYFCYSLASISIPDDMTSIGKGAFKECRSLASVTIPDGVTSIEDSAFYSCYGMAEYHLKPTTPPRLSATNAFSGIPSDCVIYVPAGSLEAYQTATNWATYADKMREEPV
ncbi:leucine-rich repeat domain-containing protein [Pseudoflavonifractor sp. HCP28S3_F10]|uniref:leucine-rich repeat domain-containing protein n=1 Tax=Pseudoflavonifractor sp. HCP28S3_F10 TaxID=3438947 RepID=UPI003F89F3ED